MKKKSFNKKLNLRKSTISNLNLSEMNKVIGAREYLTDELSEDTLTRETQNFNCPSFMCISDPCNRVTDVDC